MPPRRISDQEVAQRLYRSLREGTSQQALLPGLIVPGVILEWVNFFANLDGYQVVRSKEGIRLIKPGEDQLILERHIDPTGGRT